MAQAASTEPVRFAESLNKDQLALKDIDFRRGQDGAGRVIVNLPSAQVGVDIRQQGQSLVVEFLRSSLPETLRRRLDVADFGTWLSRLAISRLHSSSRPASFQSLTLAIYPQDGHTKCQFIGSGPKRLIASARHSSPAGPARFPPAPCALIAS